MGESISLQIRTAKSTNCQRCPLAAQRTHIVEGSGVGNAPLMCVGEAPGREEDETGTSFVGESGVLLRTTLAQFGITTDKLFTTNVVRCRPPENRDPTNEEIGQCFGWLSQEIMRVRPRVVLALGKHAVAALLPFIPTLSALNIRYFEAYHPAYISRSPSMRPTWEAQVKKACRAALGIIERPSIYEGDCVQVEEWFDGTPDYSHPFLAADTETDDLTEGVGVKLICWSVSDGEYQEFRDDAVQAMDGVHCEERLWADQQERQSPEHSPLHVRTDIRTTSTDNGCDAPVSHKGMLRDNPSTGRDEIREPEDVREEHDTDGRDKRSSGMVSTQARTPWEALQSQGVTHLWMHNSKYDLPLLGIDPWDMSKYDDTMIVAYLLRKHIRVGLKEIGPALTGIAMHSIKAIIGTGKDQIPFSQALKEKPAEARDYAMRDALVTSRIAPKLWADLQAEPPLMWLYENVEKPLIPVLLGMEQRGVLVNGVTLKEMEAELDLEIEKIAESLRVRLNLPLYSTGVRVIKWHDPLASPKQLGPALVDAGVPLRRKTRKTGQIQTDETSLLGACHVDRVEELREGDTSHEIVRDLLLLRGYTKLKSTYVQPLYDRRDANGRVHGRFNQAVASTGRLSSSDPNLQNIPIRTDFGKRLRRVFEAKPGHVFVKGDYSQLEVRIYAHFTQESVLLDAYFHTDHDTLGPGGKCLRCDVHQGVANEVGIPRKDAKNVLFAAIYGASESKIAETAGVPRKNAGAFLTRLRGSVPSLVTWRQRVANEITRNGGYVETILKRREYFPEILSPLSRIAEEALRQAANHPIQGSASDIVKVFMNRVARELCPQWNADMVLMVHDELVFEVPVENAKPFGRLLAQMGADVGKQVGLTVPLEFSVDIGYNWGDTIPLEEWSDEVLTCTA